VPLLAVATVTAALILASGAVVNAAAPIMPPGTRIERIRTHADGHETRIWIQRSADGRLTFGSGAAGSSDVSPAATGPCADRAFKLSEGPWATPYEWSFRASTTPSDLSVAKVEAKLRRAASNITNARNDCGRADRVSATHAYKGRTRKRPQPCDFFGGVSVVDFGLLPPGVTGQADICWSFEGDGWVAIQGHVRLNKGVYRWALKTAGCRGRSMVEAVATHEFGHVFGLDHVSEARHPRLTMSTHGRSCDNSPSTLGLGDMLGLEKLYPPED
jgi:hypothetical protein